MKFILSTLIDYTPAQHHTIISGYNHLLFTSSLVFATWSQNKKQKLIPQNVDTNPYLSHNWGKIQSSLGVFRTPKTKGFHRRVTPVWLSNCRQTRKWKYSNHDDYLFNLGIFLFGFQRQCFEVGLQKFDKFLHRILHLLAILSTFCLLFFSFGVFFSRKFFESLLLCGYLPYKFHVNLVFCLFFRTFLCVKPPLFM